MSVSFSYRPCIPAHIQCVSPVYEYPLNAQWIIMDIEDGYILWTGIYKGKNLRMVSECVFSLQSYSRSSRK